MNRTKTFRTLLKVASIRIDPWPHSGSLLLDSHLPLQRIAGTQAPSLNSHSYKHNSANWSYAVVWHFILFCSILFCSVPFCSYNWPKALNVCKLKKKSGILVDLHSSHEWVETPGLRFVASSHQLWFWVFIFKFKFQLSSEAATKVTDLEDFRSLICSG